MSAHAQLVTAHAEGIASGVRFERLPTNTTTGSHPVHRWYNFVAGFSPEFVKACISLHKGSPDEPLSLLDPFAGCGTALVAARQMNLAATGYDPHPFFARISEAKANSREYWPSLKQICEVLRQGLGRPVAASDVLSPSAATFLDKLFQRTTLDSLLGARIALENSSVSDNPLAFLILSRMLDHCCRAATDGIYKAPTSTKRALQPVDSLDRVLAVLNADQLEALSGNVPSRVYTDSSESMRDLGDGSIDLVVTSPPYLNNFDFAEMTRMYLYFWGMADSWGDITTRVRGKLIVNTTTALKGHKDIQDGYRESINPEMRLELDQAVELLAAKRRIKAGKKEYDLLVYPYLSQMQSVLGECLRVMKPKASFHMMISDAALYGVHLSAPQWIAKIMEDLGFAGVECHLVRPRGHRWLLDKREGSAAGLGEYYVSGRGA